jgi:hypothetical protein
MDTSLSFASLLIPAGLGLGLILALWPRERPQYLSIQLALAIGIGCGACSGLLLAWLVIAGKAGRGVLVIQGAAAILLAGRAMIRRSPVTAQTVKPRGPRFLTYGLCAILLLAAGIVVLRVLWTPNGDRDAFGSWNMKARMIYLGGAHWRDVFSPLLPDLAPDYPLLVPLSVVGLWLLVGKAAVLAPALLAVAFTCSTVLLLGSGLSALRDRSQALLAAVVLAASPFFIIWGTSQYADVEVAFFILATLVLLALHNRERGSRLLILAGLAAGLAGWSKNEGLIFLVVVGAVVAWSSGLRSGRWRDLIWYGAGAALPLSMVVYLKVFLSAGPNLMVAGGLHSTSSRILDFSRYRMVGAAFLSEFAHLGNWPVSILLLLLLYAVIAWRKTRTSRPGPGFAASLAVVFLMLAAYFMIFVLTPLDLNLHLLTALDRLIVQLWPGALFLFFLFVPTVQDILTDRSRGVWRARLTSLWLAALLLAGIWAAGATLLARWKGDGRTLELRLAAYERRLSNIKMLLPDHGVIGYTAGEPLRMAQLARTQYFMAPLIVLDSPEPEIVLWNLYSLDPNDERPYESYKVEGHAGMKVYDFGTGIYLEDRRGMYRR